MKLINNEYTFPNNEWRPRGCRKMTSFNECVSNFKKLKYKYKPDIYNIINTSRLWLNTNI